MVDFGPGLRSHKVQLSQVRMHYVEAGAADAPLLLLLHGWPQTWLAWWQIIPHLAQRYRVVAPDLRGLGDTTRPVTGYDAQTLAGDVIELVNALGVSSFGVAGHDNGAIVAHAVAALDRDRVKALAILDIVLPGYGLDDFVRLSPDGWGIWHFPFHASPMAEFLIRGREREYLNWFFRNMAYAPGAIPAEHVDEYVRAYSQPGAMRAGLAYYAAYHQDGVQAQSWGETKLKMPVLGIGGSASIGSLVGVKLREIADDVTGEVAPECGHWIPEEQPAWLAERLETFFANILSPSST
ncbi:alpha/beta hydrolase [Sphingomonas populi]|uniref:Alpha/beta hydrolase n=1 Tax=Sphingomonas populi TaxID=2484750 RepID=A0A4Q6XP43_9SPHN|nr:alpha/beta hydrolase [Sphingomonas populi]RZF59084.1 alpha/beta hydrolase [Sphingomonas populi]